MHGKISNENDDINNFEPHSCLESSAELKQLSLKIKIVAVLVFHRILNNIIEYLYIKKFYTMEKKTKSNKLFDKKQKRT
jgi:hypothetical protein